ncbi:MAG: LysE family translocator [Thiolinea sp.]
MLEQAIIIIGITFMVMISPGPDMLIVIRNTLIGGKTAGLQTSAGIVAGNLVHISYCLVGIGLLISQSIVLFTILKLLSAAYLIYLGISSLRSKPQPLDATSSLPASSRTWFIQGFLNNILNPKGALFYLGVFTVVITPDTTLLATVLLVLLMKSISIGFWVLFVSALDQPVVRNGFGRFQSWINKLFGGLLILLGIKVATASQ